MLAAEHQMGRFGLLSSFSGRGTSIEFAFLDAG
jgi:hypothetical protein